MAVADKALETALLQKKLISKKALSGLLEQAKARGVSLESALFEREVVTDEELGKLLAELHGLPFVKLTDRTIPENLLRLIPYPMASGQFILAFEQNGEGIHVALNNPSNHELVNFLEKKTGVRVVPHYATPKDLKAALKAYNRDVNQKFTGLLKSVMADPTKMESLKDAAKILDTVILFAYQNNASDIHLEPHKQFFIVRYRVDGILHTIAEMPISIADLLTTRIKVLANLRTDEHRAAQDGRFKIDLDGNEITMRVSVLPVYEGEKSVLRLLSSSQTPLDLESLGYSERNLDVIHDNILKTTGILLITGPTGSGKTTTLYSVLKLLNSPEVNIATIEDPIEYRLEGINQVQLNAKTNLTFATGLRSLLRQDPDIVMVGEIRDEETASIAINAALTGHLVLATLHTNDAASTLPRLLEMNVESFLLAATAKLVVAQRLVRKICAKCKKSYELPKDKLNAFGKKLNLKQSLEDSIRGLLPKDNKPVTLYKGEGCAVCNGSGFKGRVSIAEVMEVSESIRKLILENAAPSRIEEQAVTEGMPNLFIDGLAKALQGATTLEEVLRVMRS
jgi:type IV pilus assembly protein PilB